MRRVLCCLLILLGAQRCAAADLFSVYLAALNHDAGFAAKRAANLASAEKIAQGRAGLLPNISASVNSAWNDVDYVTRSTPAQQVASKYNSHGWQVTLTQPLFRWQNWLAYQLGQWQVALSDAEYRATQMDLMVKCALAYFDVLVAEENWSSVEAQKKAISEQLAAARQNFIAGSATITDTHEAQSRYDLATAQALLAQNDLELRRENLALLTGNKEEKLRPLRRDLNLPLPSPTDINLWAQRAMDTAPAVLMAAANVELARTEAEKQKATHYPTLDLVAAKVSNTQGATPLSGQVYPGSTTENTSIAVQLALPIYSGGLAASRSREAALGHERALFEAENARRYAALEARAAYLNVMSGLSQIKAYEAALASSRLALDANKLGYTVGVRVNIDVLNAQSQVFDTGVKLMKARADTLVGLLKLKAATGTLEEKDLMEANQLLQ